MSRNPKEEELTRLISALLDGRLSPQEHERLESLLLNEQQARRLYMQMVDQEIELPCLIASAQGKVAMGHVSPSTQRGPQRVRWVFAAAGAVGVLTLLAIIVLQRPPAKSVIESSQRMAPLPSVSGTWAEDFEGRAPTLWYGRIVTNDLPSGSKYGIAAAMREYPTGGPAYVVQLPEDWSQGLFALTTQSTMHVTYRLGNTGHVNVFMHTIPIEANATDYAMYQLRGTPFSGQTGQWHTASIPFAQFVRKVEVEPGGARSFVGGPPQPGELVTTLSFSSVDPIDFVVDRVWITPGASSSQP